MFETCLKIVISIFCFSLTNYAEKLNVQDVDACKHANTLLCEEPLMIRETLNSEKIRERELVEVDEGFDHC